MMFMFKRDIARISNGLEPFLYFWIFGPLKVFVIKYDYLKFMWEWNNKM